MRSQCDVDLGNEGRAECKRHYPDDGSCPYSVTAALCPKYFLEVKACSDAVTLMYDVAVGNQGPLKMLSGEPAFHERQVQHYNCCGN